MASHVNATVEFDGDDWEFVDIDLATAQRTSEVDESTSLAASHVDESMRDGGSTLCTASEVKANAHEDGRRYHALPIRLNAPNVPNVAQCDGTDGLSETQLLGELPACLNKVESTRPKAVANPNLKDNLDRTPLPLAFGCQDIDTVGNLLVGGADPHMKDNHGRTPLSRAFDLGGIPTITWVLDSGVNPNLKDNLGRTALSQAFQLGNPDVIMRLLKDGANPDLKDNLGRTPLSLAFQLRNVGIITRLLDARPDPNMKDNLGRTPLSQAFEFGMLVEVRTVSLT